MINRAAVILRYKAPAIQWINGTCSDGEFDLSDLTVEMVNRERAVYLISDEDAESDETLSAWIEMNFEVLFSNELEGWCTDESIWPDPLTLELFQEWFDVECHSVVLDTVDEMIQDDDNDNDTLH